MIQQRTLFDQPVLARSRGGDPDTSRQAAREHNARGRTATHKRIVLAAIQRRPGMTSAELAAFCELERHEAARRTADLLREGLVRQGAVRKCSVGRRDALTWWPR